jgi:RimJ/RimL family protein N-acetyltransferase
MSAEQLLELNRSRWDHDQAATFSICDATGACVGYWPLPETRGKGPARRAVTPVSRWALGDLALARLALFTEPSNRQ